MRISWLNRGSVSFGGVRCTYHSWAFLPGMLGAMCSATSVCWALSSLIMAPCKHLHWLVCGEQRTRRLARPLQPLIPDSKVIWTLKSIYLHFCPALPSWSSGSTSDPFPVLSLQQPCRVGEANRWQLAQGHPVSFVVEWGFELSPLKM